MASAFPMLPPGFCLGTSSAAYSTEGAAREDGRGPSIWDTYVREPERVTDGTTGDVAADGYHRVDEDVALIKRLGVRGHRFSISWSRVIPTGTGRVNQRGLDFYDRLVDRLVEAGVEPLVVLHHYDLPQGLEDDGGWLNRGTVDRFAEYAAVVGERLADRVTHWVPFADPNATALLGYGLAAHAPGKFLVLDSLPAVHHILMAHGRAVVALRDAGASSIGTATNHAPCWPASDDDADVGATKIVDALWNGMFVEPMLLGRYPVDVAPFFEEFAQPGDLAVIRQPLDFYGVNYSTPIKIGVAPEGAAFPFQQREIVGYPTTVYGWAVVPDGLRELLILLRARYRAALPPLVVTGSGASYNMGPDAQGVVDDQPRIDYLAAHLEAVAASVMRGVDVRGFYVHSLLDGFEWGEGHSQRFGLVHVDPHTRARTPKRSYDWLRGVVAAQPQHV